MYPLYLSIFRWGVTLKMDTKKMRFERDRKETITNFNFTESYKHNSLHKQRDLYGYLITHRIYTLTTTMIFRQNSKCVRKMAHGHNLDLIIISHYKKWGQRKKNPFKTCLLQLSNHKS